MYARRWPLGESFGCSSWKSRKNAGCGFVIWKREKGHEVSREEAAERIVAGHQAVAEGGSIEDAAKGITAATS